jgi:hypothetical protein
VSCVREGSASASRTAKVVRTRFINPHCGRQCTRKVPCNPWFGRKNQGNLHAMYRATAGLIKKTHIVSWGYFERACNISSRLPDKMHPTSIG